MKNTAAALASRTPDPKPRLTRNDRVVLACLETRGEPMKAYELLERLREEGINAPMTVYRALGRLANHGLVRKMESINAYFALPQGEETQLGAFLVCASCGAVGFSQLELSKVGDAAPGFRVVDASIELKTECFSDETRPLSGQCARDRQ